jgi:hypothetical protein
MTDKSNKIYVRWYIEAKDLFRQFRQILSEPWRAVVLLKRLTIIISVASLSLIIYFWAISNIRAEKNIIFSILIIWFPTAYVLLPIIHRVLSKIYVPDYFIGRTRTGDGLLADPINLAIVGDKASILKTMKDAGWEQSDPMTIKSIIKMLFSGFFMRSYPNAPVSNLYVFSKRQDLVFQKQVDGNPRKRHHVRLWKIPKDQFLPGGHKADWVGAATYDDAVGVSLFTLQLTHAIDGDVDLERDFVVNTIKLADSNIESKEIEQFFPNYHDRNGGGHKFFTDGSLVILSIKNN